MDAYETDPIKLTNQIYEKLVASIKTSSTTVTINNHKYKVTLHEEMFNSTGNAWAYIYPETGGMTTLTYTNVFDDEGKEALANYCALLAQLNTDLWKEFLAYYVSDGFGLLDIKTVTKKNVLDVLNKTEKVIKALSDTSLTKADANALVEEMGDTVKDKLKSGLTNKFKKFVQENVPNGDKIVSASEKYKKAKEKYDKFKKLWDADSTSDKTQKAYNDFQTAYSAFETIVNGL